MSNSTVDFQRILATSPTSEKKIDSPKKLKEAQKRLEEGEPNVDRITPDSLAGSEEERKPTETPRKKKRGFLGMLDAAVTYFDEKQVYPTNSFVYPSNKSNIENELTEQRKEFEYLETSVKELEAANDDLRKENQRLAAQRESYVLSIGSLNAKILDLQLVLDEQKTENVMVKPQRRDGFSDRKTGSVSAFPRDDSGSLDISEIKSESVVKQEQKQSRKAPDPVQQTESKVDASPLGRHITEGWAKPQTPSFTKIAGVSVSRNPRQDVRSKAPIYFS